MSSEPPVISSAALAVPPYRSRRTEHLGVVTRQGWTIKIIGIAADGRMPQDGTVQAALALCDANLPRPTPDNSRPRVAFVVVHRGEEALWVIVSRWELDLLYQRLFRADLDSTALRRVAPDGPTACVWELLAIDHERRAWVEHVLTHPDRPDIEAYLTAGVSGYGASSYRPEDSNADAGQPDEQSTPMTVERLRAFAAAWARGDVDELLSYLTDDCVYAASVGPEPGRTYRGRDEVRQGFAELLAYDAGGESRSGDAFICGTRGALEWSYVFTDPDGRQREVRGCDLFEFRGNKIVAKNAFRKTTA